MFELSGVNYEEALEQGGSILVRVIASSSYRGFELSGVRVIGGSSYRDYTVHFSLQKHTLFKMDLKLAVICQSITFQMSRFNVYYFVFVNRTYVRNQKFCFGYEVCCYRQRNGDLWC